MINLTQYFRSDNHRDNARKSEKKEDQKKYIPQKNDDKFDTNFEGNWKKGIVNIKQFRKCLILCAKTVVYQRSGFKFHIISNITPQITDLSGDFIRSSEDKTRKLRW